MIDANQKLCLPVIDRRRPQNTLRAQRVSDVGVVGGAFFTFILFLQANLSRQEFPPRYTIIKQPGRKTGLFVFLSPCVRL